MRTLVKPSDEASIRPESTLVDLSNADQAVDRPIDELEGLEELRSDPESDEESINL